MGKRAGPKFQLETVYSRVDNRGGQASSWAGCSVRAPSKKSALPAAGRSSHVPPSRWSSKWSRSKYGRWKAMSESPGRAQPSELQRAAAAAAAITAIATSAPARRRGCHRTGVGRDGTVVAEEREAAVSGGAGACRGPAVEREPACRGEPQGGGPAERISWDNYLFSSAGRAEGPMQAGADADGAAAAAAPRRRMCSKRGGRRPRFEDSNGLDDGGFEGPGALGAFATPHGLSR